jgi:hypothetical protein
VSEKDHFEPVYSVIASAIALSPAAQLSFSFLLNIWPQVAAVNERDGRILFGMSNHKA